MARRGLLEPLEDLAAEAAATVFLVELAELELVDKAMPAARQTSCIRLEAAAEVLVRRAVIRPLKLHQVQGMRALHLASLDLLSPTPEVEAAATIAGLAALVAVATAAAAPLRLEQKRQEPLIRAVVVVVVATAPPTVARSTAQLAVPAS